MSAPDAGPPTLANWAGQIDAIRVLRPGTDSRTAPWNPPPLIPGTTRRELHWGLSGVWRAVFVPVGDPGVRAGDEFGVLDDGVIGGEPAAVHDDDR